MPGVGTPSTNAGFASVGATQATYGVTYDANDLPLKRSGYQTRVETFTGTGNYGRRLTWPTGEVPIRVGDTVRFMFWIKVNQAVTINPYTEYSDIAGGFISAGASPSPANVSLAANIWTLISVTASPTNAGTAWLRTCGYLNQAQINAGFELRFGPWFCTVNQTLPESFMESDTPGWRWTGTIYESQSVGYPYTLENIAGRPAAYYDARYLLGKGVALPADGAAISQWVDLSGNGRHLTQATSANQPKFRSISPNLLTYTRATHAHPDSSGAPGWGGYGTLATYSTVGGKLRQTIPAGATGWLGMYQNNDYSPCIPGETVTAEGTITGVAGTFTAYMTIEFKNDAEGGATNIRGAASVSSSGRVTCTTTVPAGLTRMRLVPHLTSYQAGTTVVDWDQFGAYKGSLPAAWSIPAGLPGSSPVVQLDGVNDKMSASLSQRAIDPITIYAVAAMYRSNGTAEAIMEWQQGLRLRRLSDSQMGFDVNSAPPSGFVSSGRAFTVSKPFVISAVNFSNYAVQVAIDGIDGATSTPGGGTNTTVFPQFDLGERDTAPTEGEVAALLIYQTAHNNTTRDRIEKWLGAQYGIAVT